MNICTCLRPDSHIRGVRRGRGERRNACTPPQCKAMVQFTYEGRGAGARLLAVAAPLPRRSSQFGEARLSCSTPTSTCVTTQNLISIFVKLWSNILVYMTTLAPIIVIVQIKTRHGQRLESISRKRVSTISKSL